MKCFADRCLSPVACCGFGYCRELNSGLETKRLATKIVNDLEHKNARLLDFVRWVDCWVSNPAGSYSTSALDGLFGMTRDKISNLNSHEERDCGRMKIFRLYHETKGGHVHCRLFAGPHEGALGKCGDLCMRTDEFELFKKFAAFIQYRAETSAEGKE